MHSLLLLTQKTIYIVGMKTESHSVIAHPLEISFANIAVACTDSSGIADDQFSYVLKKSMFYFIRGVCLDFDLQEWFDFPVPDITIKANFNDHCQVGISIYDLRPSTIL